MAKETAKKKEGLRSYFKGVRLELRKVVWPTKEELISYTWVVVLFCAVFALVFWAIDSACGIALQKLLGITINV
jgi:preprotein translocase subunit SecE